MLIFLSLRIWTSTYFSDLLGIFYPFLLFIVVSFLLLIFHAHSCMFLCLKPFCSLLSACFIVPSQHTLGIAHVLAIV